MFQTTIRELRSRNVSGLEAIILARKSVLLRRHLRKIGVPINLQSTPLSQLRQLNSMIQSLREK